MPRHLACCSQRCDLPDPPEPQPSTCRSGEVRSATGSQRETGLLKKWPTNGPKLVWQANDIGDGYSTPAVAGTQIYLMSNRGMENEFVQALSTDDGKPFWTARVGNVGNPKQDPPYPKARSTPTVDGDFVYALGSDGDLVCLDSKDGKIRCRKNLQNEFGGQPSEWAYAESPLVDGDVLVVTQAAHRPRWRR